MQKTMSGHELSDGAPSLSVLTARREHAGVFARLNRLTRMQERVSRQQVVESTSPESSLYIATMSFTDTHAELLCGISHVTFALMSCNFTYIHQEIRIVSVMEPASSTNLAVLNWRKSFEESLLRGSRKEWSNICGGGGG